MDITIQSHLQGEWAGWDLRTMMRTLQKRLRFSRRENQGSRERIKSKVKGEKSFKGLLLSADRCA